MDGLDKGAWIQCGVADVPRRLLGRIHAGLKPLPSQHGGPLGERFGLAVMYLTLFDIPASNRIGNVAPRSSPSTAPVDRPGVTFTW